MGALTFSEIVEVSRVNFQEWSKYILEPRQKMINQSSNTSIKTFTANLNGFHHTRWLYFPSSKEYRIGIHAHADKILTQKNKIMIEDYKIASIDHNNHEMRSLIITLAFYLSIVFKDNQKSSFLVLPSLNEYYCLSNSGLKDHFFSDKINPKYIKAFEAEFRDQNITDMQDFIMYLDTLETWEDLNKSGIFEALIFIVSNYR